MSVIIRSKNLAVIAIYAALYAALVVVLGAFSYGPVQVRVADAMLAVVPLLGLAGVLGHTLGVFVANIFSTVGPIDLLNTIPSFAMSFVVYYVYKRTKNDYTVIGTCHSLLCCHRHNGWMDAVIPVRFTTTNHDIIRNHRKFHCERTHRMANL